ncbi:HMG-box, partial [Marasmius fiardii PR-910]
MPRSVVGNQPSHTPRPNHIPRPPNAFILYRAVMLRQLSKKPQSALSQEIGKMWKSLDAEERRKWYDLAEEAKQQHSLAYPGYKYRPER